MPATKKKKNELLPDIAKRMSLDRFFAVQRDIVNDELESVVPDLVEDALENPTGTYQRTTEKTFNQLTTIDKTTKSIKQDTKDILYFLRKDLSDKLDDLGGGGGGILDTIMGVLGYGAAGAGALKAGKSLLGRGKPPVTQTATPKGPDPRTGRYKVSDLPAEEQKKFLERGRKPTDFIKNSEAKAAGLASRAEETASAVAKKPGVLSRIFGGAASFAKSTVKFAANVAGKLIKPAVAALAIWKAWSQIAALPKPPEISHDDYRDAISRILLVLVEDFGFALVGAGIGALLGLPAFGVGAVPGALIGAISGLALEYAVGDDIKEIMLDPAYVALVGKVVEYFIAADTTDKDKEKQKDKTKQIIKSATPATVGATQSAAPSATLSTTTSMPFASPSGGGGGGGGGGTASSGGISTGQPTLVAPGQEQGLAKKEGGVTLSLLSQLQGGAAAGGGGMAGGGGGETGSSGSYLATRQRQKDGGGGGTAEAPKALTPEQQQVFSDMSKGGIDASSSRASFLQDKSPEQLSQMGVEKVTQRDGTVMYQQKAVSDQEAIQSLKTKTTSGSMTVDPNNPASLMFSGFMSAETGGKGDAMNPDRFIRTKVSAASNAMGGYKPSSAYGPVQMTKTYLEDFKYGGNKAAGKTTSDYDAMGDKEKAYLDALIEQGGQMLKAGENDPVYGLGGKGTLGETEEQRSLYMSVAQRSMARLARNSKDYQSFVKAYRGGHEGAYFDKIAASMAKQGVSPEQVYQQLKSLPPEQAGSFKEMPMLAEGQEPTAEMIAQEKKNIAKQREQAAANIVGTPGGQTATQTASAEASAGTTAPVPTAEQEKGGRYDEKYYEDIIKQYDIHADREGSTENLSPEIKARLGALYRDAPDYVKKELKIQSAFRDPKLQAQLHAQSGGSKYVAKNSQHSQGMAVDLGSGKGGSAKESWDNLSPETKQWMAENGEKYGIYRPMQPGLTNSVFEDWHFEPIGNRGNWESQPKQPKADMAAWQDPAITAQKVAAAEKKKAEALQKTAEVQKDAELEKQKTAETLSTGGAATVQDTQKLDKMFTGQGPTADTVSKPADVRSVPPMMPQLSMADHMEALKQQLAENSKPPPTLIQPTTNPASNLPKLSKGSMPMSAIRQTSQAHGVNLPVWDGTGGFSAAAMVMGSETALI